MLTWCNKVRKNPNLPDADLYKTIQEELSRRRVNKIWTPQRHLRYIEAVRIHGRDFDKIASHVGGVSAFAVERRVNKLRYIKRSEKVQNGKKNYMLNSYF